ncbi:interferon-induced protein 44-like [Trichomycterus rosablanca]|uniref:interferon-induced protein 44-like n=1 Tax=Trichomycterus rosablanca TaxID=2290929 RepID=UPI002F354E4A
MYDAPVRREKGALQKKLRQFKVETSHAPNIRILIVGAVGAGKSSFINSVNNVFQGRITCDALTDSTAGYSFTKVYKTYKIKGDDGSPLAFIFNDMMGLQETYETLHQDIIEALKGFVQEGYKFNPASPLSDKDHSYRSDPSLEQQTFCLVYVMEANTVSIMHDEVIKRLKHIRLAAADLDMPQVIIMTKPDEVCPLVKKDIRKIYTSKKIKAKMEECRNLVGVPMNHIFPVKNYHEEVDTKDDMDFLILKALDQIVNIANDAQQRKAPSHKPEYKTHHIKGHDGSPLAFVFNDIMGLEEKSETLDQDIIEALKGFVQEGYKFNPASPLTNKDHGYRSHPSLEHETFCLVHVMAANSVSMMDDKVIKRMKFIRLAAADLDMPQVIIMTKPDEACPLVKKDIRKIYTSKKIKAKMEVCRNLVGVPMNHIFPVKNYHEEVDTDDDMDFLILKALDQIVNIASDSQQRRAPSHKPE